MPHYPYKGTPPYECLTDDLLTSALKKPYTGYTCQGWFLGVPLPRRYRLRSLYISQSIGLSHDQVIHIVSTEWFRELLPASKHMATQNVSSCLVSTANHAPCLTFTTPVAVNEKKKRNDEEVPTSTMCRRST